MKPLPKAINWIKQHPILAIIGALIIVACLWAAYLHFVENRPWAGWTGFEAYTAPDGTYFPAKNLWDVLELLIIPAIIGLGIAWLNWQLKMREQKVAQERAERERDLAQDQQREEALQSYLDKMTELLLEKHLLEKKDSEDDPVIDVAQIRTVTTLRTLDTDRRNILTQFVRDAKLADSILEEASLIDVDLSDTDLSDINLAGAKLGQANLNGALLLRTNMRDAILYKANLKRAYFGLPFGHDIEIVDYTRSGAILINAVLAEADLSDATLFSADLSGANFRNTNLTGADLTKAVLRDANNLTDKQLAKVKSLRGATMPDGTLHE